MYDTECFREMLNGGNIFELDQENFTLHILDDTSIFTKITVSGVPFR